MNYYESWAYVIYILVKELVKGREYMQDWFLLQEIGEYGKLDSKGFQNSFASQILLYIFKIYKP